MWEEIVCLIIFISQALQVLLRRICRLGWPCEVYIFLEEVSSPSARIRTTLINEARNLLVDFFFFCRPGVTSFRTFSSCECLKLVYRLRVVFFCSWRKKKGFRNLVSRAQLIWFDDWFKVFTWQQTRRLEVKFIDSFRDRPKWKLFVREGKTPKIFIASLDSYLDNYHMW